MKYLLILLLISNDCWGQSNRQLFGKPITFKTVSDSVSLSYDTLRTVAYDTTFTRGIMIRGWNFIGGEAGDYYEPKDEFNPLFLFKDSDTSLVQSDYSKTLWVAYFSIDNININATTFGLVLVECDTYNQARRIAERWLRKSKKIGNSPITKKNLSISRLIDNAIIK